MKLYIAGPMRGKPKLNFPRFFEIEALLVNLGHTVVNPARMDCEIDGLDPDNPGEAQDKPLDAYMKRDLSAIEACDGIVLFDDWTLSAGACREAEHAIALKKTLFLYEGGAPTAEPAPPSSGKTLLPLWLKWSTPSTVRWMISANAAARKARLERIHADEPGRAKHFSDGKPMVQLVPPSLVLAVGKVLGYGCSKYGTHNWRRGTDWSEFLGSALRHLYAFMEGEDDDPESNLSHLAHAACNLAFLIEYHAKGMGTDDRWKNAEAPAGDTAPDSMA